jgi:hypothetical protein
MGRTVSRVEGVRTRDWATVDFYAVLGVEPSAPAEDIAGAFRGLAKRLHPDRPESTGEEADRFTTVVAAYEVLGNARLRRAYDEVRAAERARRPVVTVPASASASAPGPSATVASAPPAPLDARRVRRNARRWLGGGVAVFIAGVLVSVVVVRLQAHDHARRSGRVTADATIVTEAGHPNVFFVTSSGQSVVVPEPTRVDPGTDAPGTRLRVLYRPDEPSDVIADESTTARNITLWIVALKLLVGGVVFMIVGGRRLRRVSATEIG